MVHGLDLVRQLDISAQHLPIPEHCLVGANLELWDSEVEAGDICIMYLVLSWLVRRMVRRDRSCMWSICNLYVLEQPSQSSLNGSLRINCSGTAPGWRSLQRWSSTRCWGGAAGSRVGGREIPDYQPRWSLGWLTSKACSPNSLYWPTVLYCTFLLVMFVPSLSDLLSA